MLLEGDEAAEEGEEGEGEDERLGREGRWERDVSIGNRACGVGLSMSSGRWLGGRGAAARVDGERPEAPSAKTFNNTASLLHL